VSGTVGGEAASLLQVEGVPYRPGTTVGLSGLQQAFQRTLVGAPTTEVVREYAAGQVVSVEQRWTGHAGTDVRTTISASVQEAAHKALQSVRGSAAIVAISATTGHVLAVAQRDAGDMPPVQALSGKYQPGQAFTIVSTAALLNTGLIGVNMAIPCDASNPVGGENFTNDPPVPNRGTFRADFADACSTAFAGLSLKLSARELWNAAAGFGLGKAWQLPLDRRCTAGAGHGGRNRRPALRRRFRIARDRRGRGLPLCGGQPSDCSGHRVVGSLAPANDCPRSRQHRRPGVTRRQGRAGRGHQR
jgi:cell division protein FtsI/penicillin-binding protein 2